MTPLIGASSDWYVSREATAIVTNWIHLTFHMIYRIEDAPYDIIVGIGIAICAGRKCSVIRATTAVEPVVTDMLHIAHIITRIRVVRITARLHCSTRSIVPLG